MVNISYGTWLKGREVALLVGMWWGAGEVLLPFSLLPVAGMEPCTAHQSTSLFQIAKNNEAVTVAHRVQTHMPQPQEDGKGEGTQREYLCPLSWSVHHNLARDGYIESTCCYVQARFLLFRHGNKNTLFLIMVYSVQWHVTQPTHV
jgi:hypothetical protein